MATSDADLLLARYKIRFLRAIIRHNADVITIHEIHNSQLRSMIVDLEREITRTDIHETIRINPILGPPIPTLRRQHSTGMTMGQIDDLINNTN